MKKKILVSAYAISPVRGSEYGAAWNTVINLAKQHELWVLYGMSDDHMGDTQTMRNYIANNPLDNIHFVEVRAGWLAMAINMLNKIGFGWCFYFAYYLWQKSALNAAHEILETVDIDVIHQLGPIGFREPGFLWKLDKPMVWGPIGGLNVIDKRLLANKPFMTKLKFSVKNFINYLQLNYSGRIRKAFQTADVLIAATSAGQQTIWEKFGIECVYMPEQGIVTDTNLDPIKFRHINEQVQLVWSGSLNERKNLSMCLDVLAGIKQTNWVLHVLGSGSLAEKLREKADELNLSSHIRWHGHLPRKDAVKIMSASHLHIITSISEDNPAVIFEALTYCVPTLTVNHWGMGDVICSKCGFKIKLDGYDAMVSNMQTVLVNVLNDPAILINRAITTMNCADEHNWEKRLFKLNKVYSQAIQTHEIRTKLPVVHQILTAKHASQQ